MKQKIPYTLIDTAGQTTAVIDVFVPRPQQPNIAKPLMKKIKNIGQVCFIEKDKNNYRLQMMGNELSVNGIAAGSFYIAKKLNKTNLELFASGLSQKIDVSVKNNIAQIKFASSIIKFLKNNLIEINGGIKYLIKPGVKKVKKVTNLEKNELKNIAGNFPASGIVYYQKNKIQPLIFVKATNTFVWETSCGSGSIAFAKVTKMKKIVQPSGKKILVKFNKDTIVYETEVKYELRRYKHN